MSKNKNDPAHYPIIMLLEELMNVAAHHIAGGKTTWDLIRSMLLDIKGNRFKEILTPEAGWAAEMVRNLASDLLASIDRHDADRAAVVGLRLGCMLYRLHVDFFGEMIKTGHRVIEGGKKGSEVAHGPAQERQARNAGWQQWIKETLKRQPTLSYEKACTLLAKQQLVSIKTIKRNTINPRSTRGTSVLK